MRKPSVHVLRITAFVAVVVMTVLGFARIDSELSKTSDRVARNAERLAPSNILGPYPRQTVTNRVEGIDGPAVHLGGTLVVEGELCAKRTAPVLTTLSWQARGATGTFITVAIELPQVREKGCQSFTVAGGNPFRNPMPDEAVEASTVLLTEGQIPEWRVVGYEVPVGENERQDFRTEWVKVVP